METVIQTEGLTKFYGGRKVVDRLELTVPAGAVYALLGDNGAGKSTTIRMLMGLLPADGGKAEILGMDCWKAAHSLRLRVGYVPEKPKFYDWMTVEEIGRFTGGFYPAGYFERYRSLLDRFGLPGGEKLKALSKGGYAKVGLALALAHDPQVLILDEPTSGLDLFTRREFLSSMVELAAEGKTILISSHGVAEVERVASHVAFLSEGRLLLHGTLDELRQRLLRVRVRHDGSIVDASGLGSVLHHEMESQEWEVVLLDPNRPALEAFRVRTGVLAYEDGFLRLEEMYTALLTPHRRKSAHNGERKPETAGVTAEEKGDRS
ncbi:MAG: ABC transporter ATP-binding protein [Gemmataceae bacterium]